MYEIVTTHAHVLPAFERAEVEFDPIIGQHSTRVSRIARQIADTLGMSDAEVEAVRWVGALHDIGKLGVEHATLHKQHLNDEEWVEMNKHPIIGESILLAISPFFAPIASAVRAHHERWDGTGHPDGRARDEIPLFARIVSVADEFDAITHSVPYLNKQALAHDAEGVIVSFSGGAFDPDVVAAFKTVNDDRRKNRVRGRSSGATTERRLFRRIR